jgi:tetratricopeptide (TPR) repeat protein
MLSPQVRILIYLFDLLPKQTSGKPSRTLTRESIAKVVALPLYTTAKILREFELKGWVVEKRATLDEVVKIGSKFEVLHYLTLQGVQKAEEAKNQLDKAIIRIKDGNQVLEMETREAISYVQKAAKIPVEMNYTLLLKNLSKGNLIDVDAVIGSIARIYPYGAKPEIEYFFGREEELKELRDFMRADSKILCLKGIGGSGKTALLNKFAPQSRREVFWYTFSDSINTGGLIRKIADFLSKLNKYKLIDYLRGEEANLIDAFLLMSEELKEANALLIFDRAERAGTELVDFFSHLKTTIEDIDVKCILSGRQIRRFYDRDDLELGLVKEMELGGLDKDCSDQLLSLMDIGKEYWDRLYKVTHGYPLFLQKATPTSTGKIDEYIFTEILKGLSLKEEHALRLASVFRFPFEDKALLAEGYGWEVIEGLVGKGVLEKVGEDAYVVQDFLRERIYEEQAFPRKVENHKIAAQYYLNKEGTLAFLEGIYHFVMMGKGKDVLANAIRKGGKIIDEGYAEEFLETLQELKKVPGISPKYMSYLYFHEGHAYSVLGEYDKAIKQSKLALEYADPNLKPKIWRWLGDTYQLINEPSLAIQAYEKDLKFASPTGVIELLSREANLLIAHGEWDRGLKIIKRALSGIRKCKDPSIVAEVYNLAGYVYLSLWRAEEAKAYLQKALDLSTQFRSVRNLCLTNMYNSGVYYELRGYEGAKQSSINSYELGSKIRYIPALAGMYVMHAPLYKDLGELTEVADRLFKGVKLAKQKNSRQWLGEAYLNLAEISRTFGDMKNALGYANLAIDSSLKLYSNETYGEALARKGIFLMEAGKVKEGRKFLRDGTKVLRRNWCKRNETWLELQEAQASYLISDNKGVIRHLKNAIKGLEKLSNRRVLLNAYLSLARHLTEQNRIEEGNEYLKKGRELPGETCWYEEIEFSLAEIPSLILKGEKVGDKIEELTNDLRTRGYATEMAMLYQAASLALKKINNPEWRHYSRKSREIYEGSGWLQLANLVPKP